MSTWTKVFGDTFELDTVNYRTGTSSVKLTCNPTNYVYTEIRRTISINFGGDGHFRVYFYVSNDVTDTEYIQIGISSSSVMTIRFYCQINQSNKGLHTGWNTVDIYPDQWTNVGGESWDNTMVTLQIIIHPKIGTTQIVSFDSLQHGLICKPCVMMTFDDSVDSSYNEAFFFMKKRRVRGTMYIISSLIGTTGCITAEQLIKMASHGWAIGNHTRDHINLTTLSQADAQTQLATCKSALDALGLTQNSNDVAYPQGAFNQTVLNAMIAEGMTTGRTVTPTCSIIPNGDNNLVMGAWTLTNTTTLTAAKAAIDTAVTYNRPINLNFHEITPVASTTYKWATADFCALVDYIISLGLAFITIEDYKVLANGNLVV